MDAVTALALIGAGLAAGALNTLAGGGSLILLPALMLAGSSATHANATSRIAILAQCLVGAATFARGGRLPTAAARAVVPPVIVGAAIGAYVATQVSNRVFTPILLATLGAMALALLVDPRRLSPPADATPRAATGLLPGLGLLAAGFYGGLLQAGAGLVFLAIFAGGLRYDVVRANALKALVMLLYIAVTVAVFIAYDMIAWRAGLVVAVGAALGAWGAARLAMTTHGPRITRIVVVAAVVALIAVMISRL